jgi:hypothetical protein
VIERPQIGREYEYRPNTGSPKRVRVKGFRGLSWVETDGVDDDTHRSISRKQLFEVT